MIKVYYKKLYLSFSHTQNDGNGRRSNADELNRWVVSEREVGGEESAIAAKFASFKYNYH